MMGGTPAGVATMDLSELLGFPASGAGLDESAPLSTTDLRALMDRMHARSELIKDRVSKCIKLHYSDFERTIAQVGVAINRFEDISKNVAGILELLDAGDGVKLVEKLSVADKSENRNLPFDVELCQLVEETRKVRLEVEDKRNALLVVECIGNLHKLLSDVERDLSQGHFTDAADALWHLRRALGLSVNFGGEEEITETSSPSEARAFVFLREAWVNCLNKMRSSLCELLLSAVVLDKENSKLYISACLSGEDLSCSRDYDGASLKDILTSMDKIGVLDPAFAKLADGLLKTVINSIVQDPSKIDIYEDSLSCQDKSEKVVLSWVLCCNSEQEAMDITILYEKLLKVITYLHQHLCCCHDSWMMRLGQMMWPRLAEEIIAKYLSKAVPNGISEVPKFQKLAVLTKEFEVALSKVGFIRELDLDGDKLGKYAADVDIHFASKKRKHILSIARRLLVQSDFGRILLSSGSQTGRKQTILDENAVDLIFQQETCAVSWTAKELMRIVHEALDDVCISTSRMAWEFYHAARDVLLLYHAIVPVKLDKELNILSQEAIIFHNDCLYLANEILGLSYQYRNAAAPKMDGVFVFVDLSLLFRQMAEEVLKQQIHMVETDLCEALDQSNGLRNTNRKQCYENASLALEQVVFLLEKVRVLWHPLMPHSIYVKAMGFLMNMVFERVASEILVLDDMDIEETVQLRKLIFSLDESMPLFLQSLVVSANQQQERAPEDSSTISGNNMENWVPAWCKLMRLAELLDMPLMSITQAWESGNLAACGFSSSEVQKLIKAVFSDTDIRKESLNRIMTHKVS